jgi:hypothetical protein
VRLVADFAEAIGNQTNEQQLETLSYKKPSLIGKHAVIEAQKARLGNSCPHTGDGVGWLCCGCSERGR